MTWFDLSGFRIVFLYITFPSPLTPRDWWENTCTVGERHGRSKGTKGVGGVEVKMSLFLAKKGSGRLRDGVYLRLFFYPFRDCWNNWVPPLDLPLEWHRTNQLLIVHSWFFTLGLPQKGQKPTCWAFSIFSDPKSTLAMSIAVSLLVSLRVLLGGRLVQSSSGN